MAGSASRRNSSASWPKLMDDFIEKCDPPSAAFGDARPQKRAFFSGYGERKVPITRFENVGTQTIADRQAR
jgi:hypothetical protein